MRYARKSLRPTGERVRCRLHRLTRNESLRPRTRGRRSDVRRAGAASGPQRRLPTKSCREPKLPSDCVQKICKSPPAAAGRSRSNLSKGLAQMPTFMEPFPTTMARRPTSRCAPMDVSNPQKETGCCWLSIESACMRSTQRPASVLASEACQSTLRDNPMNNSPSVRRSSTNPS